MRYEDADQPLIAEMSCPPPLEQARGSLEFWQQRRRALPLYRRAGRREADVMIRQSYAQLEAALNARYGTGVVGRVRRLLAGEPIPWTLGVKPVLVKAVLRIVPRRFLIGLAAVGLLFAAVSLGLVALVIQFAGVL